MKKIKNTLLILILTSSMNIFGQGKPEAFSKEFVNCFVNYKEACAIKYTPADTNLRNDILWKLKELYTPAVKADLKGKNLTSSTRAVIKDGDDKHKQIADIFIQIKADAVTYELTLWGCYVENGKWVLGTKIELVHWYAKH